MTDETTAPPEFKPRTTATPSEARKLWESTEEPTPSKIANMLTAKGKPVSRTTIKRWFEHGWENINQQTGLRVGQAIYRAMKLCPPNGADLKEIESAKPDEVVEICGREVIEVAAMALRAIRVRLRQNTVKPNQMRDFSNYIKDLAAAIKDGSEVYAQGLELRKRGAELMAPINMPAPKPQEAEPVTLTVSNELAEDMRRWDEGKPPLKTNGNGSASGNPVSDG